MRRSLFTMLKTKEHPRSLPRPLLLAMLLLISAAGLRCGSSTIDRPLSEQSGEAPTDSAPPDDSSDPSDPPSGEVAGSPTQTALVGGSGQSATVDTAVAIPPSLRVADIEGRPVADVQVTFSIDLGGGRVDGATQRTDASGIAAPDAWILGPTPGLNRLIGEVSGLAPITFEATGVADDRGSFTIVAGDRQNARVRQAVSVAPEVLLLDGQGDPIEGRTVTFEVTSGAGSLQDASPTTDSQGRAQLGEWVLGPNPGTQTLTARTESLPDLVFQATAISEEDPTLDVTSLADVPQAWDLAFLPDGTLLVSSKFGSIVAIDPTEDPVTERTLLAPPSDVDDRGQSGLLGIAVDPAFTTNRFVYAFLSSDRSGDVDNRIRRFVLSGDGETLTEDRDILTGISWENGDHSGGRIEFGPNGFLWVGTGDNREATIPQDVNEMGGKILRVTRDGAPAPGNIDQGGRAEIFFRGVRNVQGLAFRRGDGAPFSCEHGPEENDEVTLLVNGGDGGWNPNDGAGNYNGYTGAVMSPPGTRQPAYQTDDSMGMADCTFVYGTEWQSFDGALIVGFLAGRHALAMRPNSDGSGLDGTTARILDADERLRAMVQGPDGALYTIAGDEIWRVMPE